MIENRELSYKYVFAIVPVILTLCTSSLQQGILCESLAKSLWLKKVGTKRVLSVLVLVLVVETSESRMFDSFSC